MNSDMAKGLKNCFIAAGKGVMKAGISAITEQVEEKLLKDYKAKGVKKIEGIFGGKGNEQEAFKKAMEVKFHYDLWKAS